VDIIFFCALHAGTTYGLPEYDKKKLIVNSFLTKKTLALSKRYDIILFRGST